ncbi:hypothetical protein BTA51_03820 [Hahella sp. CCB-MM4]|uniref:hypothetical protein n=1 Tax=Hahella sp. (strain CCB-MM4) TaxID=1926491 RepID=UPI000B9C4AF9|nr:hypothetical protein [Hahella sp. CCB-MM4]OZG74158.1 hypothetical protein BTA51_03820 [Hahella sp. CCB-MM4]
MDTRQRKLGLIETQMASMHELARGTTQGSEMIAIRGRFPYQVLVKAAELLFRKYAILQCAVSTHDGDYWLVQHGEFDRIGIRQEVLSNVDKCWQYYEEAINEPLAADYALWRILLLSSPDGAEHRLIVTCHHVMIDPAGYDELLRDLLGFMDALLEGENLLPGQVGIPTAVDEYLSDKPSELDTSDTPCPVISYQRNTELENRKTKVSTIVLDAREYHALDLQCRNNGVSVSNYLAGLFLCQARKEGLAGKAVVLRTAVSLRSRVKSQRDYLNQLGCYLSMVDTPLEFGQAPKPTQIAKTYQNTLFPRIFHNCYRKKNTETGRIRQEVKSLLNAEGFVHGLGLCHRGQIDVDHQYCNFMVTDYDAVTSSLAGDIACELHILQFNGGLKCSLVYTWPLVSHERIEAMRQQMHSAMLEYCLVERRLAV